MILSSKVASLSVILCTFFFISLDASTVSSAGRREWEIAKDTQKTVETVESKICALEIETPQDFFATFTAIDAVQNKVCTVDSKVNVVDSLIDQLNLNIQTISSKVDIVDQETSDLCDTINVVRVDDFGGTWTALNELDQTMCAKFDNAFDDLATIESKIDQLTIDNQAQFIATFTKLEILANDVFDTMTKVQNFADQLESDLGELDSLIDIIKNDFSTIDSKIDVLDLTIEQNFAGTFTAIESLFMKLCDVDNKIDQLDDNIETANINTLTTLKAVENKVCVVDSKVDVLNNLLELIKEKTSMIDEPIVFDCSLVDVLTMELITVNSKVDIITNKISTINSSLDIINITSETVVSKLCATDSALDQIGDIESTIDVLNIQFITIESKVDIVNAITCTIESKLCVVDTQVNLIDSNLTTAQSRLEIIDSNTQTIDSLLDVIDMTTFSAESKLCVIIQKTDTVDSSVDVVCNRLLTIDSKIDVIDSTTDAVLSAIQIIETNVDVSNSKVEIMLEDIYTTESKLCTIDVTLNTIDSSIDIINTNINSANSGVTESFESFDMTWTMLPFFQDKLCTVESRADVVSSLVDFLQMDIELGTTFTAIEDVLNKACDVEIVAQSQLDQACFFQKAFAGTFTVQDEILEKLCDSNSKLDEISLSTTLLDPIQSCLGTSIRQSDVGTTGFTISAEGRYYLAENILFAPGATADAITISADRVYLDLNGKTLQQVNTQVDVQGVFLSGVRNNITIAGGVMRGFTAAGIINSVSNGVTNILIENMIMENMGLPDPMQSQTNADSILLFDSNNIIIRNVSSLNPGNTGIDFARCANALVHDCIFCEGRSGLQINNRRVFVRNCVFNSCSESAVEINLAGAGTSVFNVKIVDSTFTNNGIDGIAVGTANTINIQDIFIGNCVIEGNGRYGISTLSNNVSSGRMMVVNNVISNNGNHGVFLDGLGTRNNIVLFNSLIENGGDNINENTSNPNTILGNFAYHSGGDSRNYDVSVSTVNKVILSQSGAFPTTIPTYWHNISMTP